MKKILIIILVSLLAMSACQLSGEDLISENISKLEDDNPFNRQQAVAALGATLNESVIKPIALMLDDTDDKVVEQTYNELTRLHTVDKPVVKNMLELFSQTEENWIDKAIIYFIETETIDLLDLVNNNIDLINQDLEVYRDLLLLSEKEANILEELWQKQKDEQVSNLILYLDKLGYTPSKDQYDKILSSENLTEQEISLILNLLVRDSFDVNYNQSEKIVLKRENNKIETINNYTPSINRCEEADRFLSTFDKELNTITKLLLIKENQPRYEEFFRRILESGYDEETKIIEDLEKLERRELEEASVYLASLEDLNNKIEKDLAIKELMASAFIEHSPDEDLLEHQKILVVFSDGSFNSTLHWQLDSAYRPNEKEEIRYIFSIPKTSGLLTFTDRYSYQELIHQEIGDETDLYELLKEAINLIEKEE